MWTSADCRRTLAGPDAITPRTILAFDFGLRRIGVAVGQTVTGSASPLPTIRNGANGPDGGRIEALTREWRPDVFVVGLPVRADGTDSAVTERVRAFAAELSEFGLPVEFVDERNTSGEAEAALKAARSRGSRGRLRKEDIDAAAAVLIAERWLASQAN